MRKLERLCKHVSTISTRVQIPQYPQKASSGNICSNPSAVGREFQRYRELSWELAAKTESCWFNERLCLRRREERLSALEEDT